jgi:hypothetical protein
MAPSPKTLAEVVWDDFDFIDLGPSHGGSIDYCTRRFGARRGLGIDIDEAKVAEAREAGFDVVVADAAELDTTNAVRFVSMMDFLEHLPDLDFVESIVERAANVATDFLFIWHPSFEGEDFLSAVGLRQYWWHWTGHTSHIQIADYCRVFERLGLTQFCIRYHQPITNSHDPSVLCTDEPIDQGEFDPDIHQARPFVQFERPLWRAQSIFIALRSFSADEWGDVTQDQAVDRPQAARVA